MGILFYCRVGDKEWSKNTVKYEYAKSLFLGHWLHSLITSPYLLFLFHSFSFSSIQIETTTNKSPPFSWQRLSSLLYLSHKSNPQSLLPFFSLKISCQEKEAQRQIYSGYTWNVCSKIFFLLIKFCSWVKVCFVPCFR